jgi:hypothetical protein
MTETGITAISIGATELSITFSTPFAFAPVVIVSVARNVGGELIQANVRMISNLGFTAELSGAVGTADYLLEWKATA